LHTFALTAPTKTDTKATSKAGYGKQADYTNSLAACVLLSRAPMMEAQQRATLSVTVTDPSNRVVPGAQVTLTSAQTSLIRTQAGDRAGLAVLSALTPGDYRLAVKAEGFSEYQQLLTLTVGQVASVDVQLGVAAVKQSVQVSESAATAVDTDKVESSQVIPPTQIADLPIAGRDFIDSGAKGGA
jgi:hypothetical protein